MHGLGGGGRLDYAWWQEGGCGTLGLGVVEGGGEVERSSLEWLGVGLGWICWDHFGGGGGLMARWSGFGASAFGGMRGGIVWGLLGGGGGLEYFELCFGGGRKGGGGGYPWL